MRLFAVAPTGLARFVPQHSIFHCLSKRAVVVVSLLLCIGMAASADTIFSTALDTAQAGWTMQGDWAYGHPDGTDPGDPSSGHTGSNVYGVCLSGSWAVWEWTVFYLTSTSIDCSSYNDVQLDFWRWLNIYYWSDMPDYSDLVYIEVSTDGGGTWTVIWTATATIQDRRDAIRRLEHR